LPTLLGDGEHSVAADTTLAQVGEGGGGVGPVGDAADFGVQAPGGDKPDQDGQIRAVRVGKSQ